MSSQGEQAWADVFAYAQAPVVHADDPLPTPLQATRHRLLTLPRPTGMLLVLLTFAVVVLLLLPIATSGQHHHSGRYQRCLGLGIPPALPRTLVANPMPTNASNARAQPPRRPAPVSGDEGVPLF
jgi:hypothetical protein